MERGKVVVVEDDPDLQVVVGGILKEAGFGIHAFGHGQAGVAAVDRHKPEVVVVDLGLPDIDGFEVTRRIRAFSNAYILILTASSSEMDTILALEAGADDYLTKPFRARELRYRVEALLRRPRLRTDTPHLTVSSLDVSSLDMQDDNAANGPGAVETQPVVLEHNGLKLHPPTRTVRKDGVEHQGLTASEFDLLHALLAGGRAIQSREELAQALRAAQGVPEGSERAADEQVIQVHIANLRRKLGDSAANPRWVETVHGFGYRMAAPEIPED
ncbi:response regulator transcription factor [Pseudarthrobacter sp. fls2-241-R2A-127]|uniref:response regulator transcription factor n=1 Tax=Pseudarthrobacter sp. fls2-241-R2A-127 TaxID=3040303 RepID=UPI0025552C96|nr:response regulator transcription factor [Pseudarthrobacter sp. fls2-241-R2A-127]